MSENGANESGVCVLIPGLAKDDADAALSVVSVETVEAVLLDLVRRTENDLLKYPGLSPFRAMDKRV